MPFWIGGAVTDTPNLPDEVTISIVLDGTDFDVLVNGESVIDEDQAQVRRIDRVPVCTNCANPLRGVSYVSRPWTMTCPICKTVNLQE